MLKQNEIKNVVTFEAIKEMKILLHQGVMVRIKPCNNYCKAESSFPRVPQKMTPVDREKAAILILKKLFDLYDQYEENMESIIISCLKPTFDANPIIPENIRRELKKSLDKTMSDIRRISLRCLQMHWVHGDLDNDISIKKTYGYLSDIFKIMYDKCKYIFPRKFIMIDIPDEIKKEITMLDIKALGYTFREIAINSLLYNRYNINKRLEIKVRRRGNLVIFDFEDNGRGISRKKMGVLFRHEKKSDGLELWNGLSIAKSVVEAHGGEIFVVKTETKKHISGTTIRVELPAFFDSIQNDVRNILV